MKRYSLDSTGSRCRDHSNGKYAKRDKCKVKGKFLEVDVWDQAGVYILYNNYQIVYVGSTTEHRLGKRLRRHLRDRHRGRWNSFSWFGIKAIKKTDGSLSKVTTRGVTAIGIIKALEAILIEVIDPPLNRIHEKIKDAVRVEQLKPERPLPSEKEMIQQLYRKFVLSE